jgi:MFS family permease
MKERENNSSNKDGTGSTEENISVDENKSKNKKVTGLDWDDQEALVNSRNNRESNASQPKAIDNLINSIGYTGYHFTLILCCGLIFFSEGNQLFSLNMLLPIIKKVFIHESEFWKTCLISALFFGYIIGSSLAGVSTKNFGRKTSINSFLFLFCVLAITIGICENIYYMTFCRLAIGMCLGMICPQYINNLSEFLPSENKEIVILSMYIFYRCGILYFIICFKLLEPDKYVNHWKETFLLSSIPVILITILSNCFFKDSPKLLLNKKELYKAVDAIYDLAREKHFSHEYEIDDREIARMKEEFTALEHENNTHNKIEFSYKNLFGFQFRFLIILCAVIFLCGSVVNVIFIYSLPLMIIRKSQENHDPTSFNHLHNDMAKEILITQIVTIPAVILSAMICRVVGRKNTIIIGFSLCFVSTFIPCFTNQGLIASSTFVNFFIIFAQCTIKVYVIEAFPTKLRDYALSFCLCVSKIGDCMVPILCNLSFNVFSLGPIAMANIVCLCGLIAAISLPFDTLGTHLE